MEALKKIQCLYKLILNYFHNRKAIISNEFEEISKTLTKGCPQGSILGPDLWTLVFNDSMDEDVDEIAYADDKVILVYANSRKEAEEKLQMALTRLAIWCKGNKLELSPAKMVIMLLKGHLDIKRPPTVKSNGVTIKMVESTKYLGVFLDTRLGVTTHIRHMRQHKEALFQFDEVIPRVLGSKPPLVYHHL